MHVLLVRVQCVSMCLRVYIIISDELDNNNNYNKDGLWYKASRLIPSNGIGYFVLIPLFIGFLMGSGEAFWYKHV